MLFFAWQIFKGPSESEQASADPDDSQQETQEPIESNDIDNPSGEEGDTTEESNGDAELDGNGEEDGTEEDDVDPEDGDELEAADGEWEPVGTEQTGEFNHDFEKGTTNWNEMERALRYATGLDDNMIVWWIKNGGSPTTAIGYVSAPDEQGTPYEVKIEFIEGEGWKPLEKEKLASNPYR